MEQLLNDKNWLRWRDEMMDKGLEFGEAGRSVRLRKIPDFRTPQLKDEVLLSTGEIFTHEVAAAKVVLLVEDGILEGLTNEDATMRVASLFEPVYENEAELSEARKILIRKKEKYLDDKAKFLALILSRLSESSKNYLRARPEYSVARDTEAT